MSDTEIRIYNEFFELTAILENAFDISYSKKMNELWTASFSLPATDEKNSECVPFRTVEIFDNGERVELFRIVPYSLQKNESTNVYTYTCEHVLATLLDDILFQYHQIGNIGVYTNEVLRYILNRQSTIRWQLGACDFARQFEYKFENENLLAALFSIPEPFTESYIWKFDTTQRPWVLHLKAISEDANPSSYIRYKKNMKSITKEVDSSQLCTRIYPLGYGEGDNQLTIKEVNNDIPYLDADTISQYGIISRVWVDRRYEYSSTLLASARSMLESLKIPTVTYKVEAAELYNITGRPADRFEVGTVVKVIDSELKEDFNAFIVSISKQNIDSDPWNCTIEIANKTEDIATSISELADRQRISEVYSQGSTNLDSHDYSDNADPAHPAILKFYIPEETVRINKVLLNFECSAFRAYSAGNLAQASKTDVTQGGGGKSYTAQSNVQLGVTTDSTPATQTTSGTYGEYTPWSSQPNGNSGFTVTSASPQPNRFQVVDGYVDINHSHYANADHNHSMLISEHNHTVEIPAHSHPYVITPHTHPLTIDDHSHSFTIEAHGHEIVYGIYEGPIPTILSVEVDGNTVPETGTSGDIDIIDYLNKDEGGKITRGTWHEIQITPNTLGRILANITIQLFVQSRGGGDY